MYIYIYIGYPGGTSGKAPACQCRRYGRNKFNPLEDGMATHSRILAWKIPWTEESGGLQVHGVTKESSDMTCDKQQQIFLLEIVYKSMKV